MSDYEVTYLFRGTTRGWSGNDVLQREGITCATTDPLVATLFALECRRWGQAVILTIGVQNLTSEEQSDRENFFSVIEQAVNILIPPAEFEKRTDLVIEIDQALSILKDMGFANLPVRIPNRQALQDALEESHHLGQRLNREQILDFVARARGGIV